MPDHVAVGKLIWDASFHATLPNFKTDLPAHDKVAPVYYMDNAVGLDFVPTEYVDITDFIETKRAMMQCHQSQVVWLKEHDNLDVIEFIDTAARMRGLQCGVSFAEGFVQAPRWLRVKPERLLP